MYICIYIHVYLFLLFRILAPGTVQTPPQIVDCWVPEKSVFNLILIRSWGFNWGRANATPPCLSETLSQSAERRSDPETGRCVLVSAFLAHW